MPYTAIRSLHTVPSTIAQKLPSDMSIHGLLAAELAVGMASGRPPFPAWNAVLPSQSDINTSIPLIWPPELQRLLPAGAKLRLRKQQRMFTRDWTAFSRGFPRIPRGSYAYAWLLVNSRTFYFETTRTATYPWVDRLAQLPVADLFNHSVEPGCRVSYSARGYEIVAVDDFGAGQEMYISYGDHSNDYLLAEYGFVLQRNKCDEVCLDDVVLPRLGKGDGDEGMTLRSPVGADELQGRVKQDGMAFTSALAGLKLQAALKTLAKGTSNSPDEVLGELVEESLVGVEKTLAELESMTGLEAERELLSRRWQQIREVLEGARTAMADS